MPDTVKCRILKTPILTASKKAQILGGVCDDVTLALDALEEVCGAARKLYERTGLFRLRALLSLVRDEHGRALADQHEADVEWRRWKGQPQAMKLAAFGPVTLAFSRLKATVRRLQTVAENINRLEEMIRAAEASSSGEREIEATVALYESRITELRTLRLGMASMDYSGRGL